MKLDSVVEKCRGGALLESLPPLLTALLFVVSCSWSHKPPKAAPPPLEYLGEWGVKGIEPGQLEAPTSLTSDALGNVYLLDRRSGIAFVQKFDAQGHPLLSFFSGNNQSPGGIAVDAGGAIYVVEQDRGQLHIFFPNGSPLRTIGSRAGWHLSAPEGVAVEDSGFIYVANSGAHCILKLSPHGRVVKVWGRKGNGPGQLESHTRVAVGPDGHVYIADIGNHRIAKFTRNGEFVAAWDFPFTDSSAETPGQARAGIAALEKYLIAFDGGKNLVEFWTLDGEPKLSETLAGRPEFSEPPLLMGVAVTPRGELLILDGAKPRILRYRINF